MQRKRICLFDVDGTLTKARQKIQQPMIQCLDKLSKVIDIGFVSGSDLVKVKQQLNEQAIEKCSYFFSENGLKAFKGSELIGEEQIRDFLGQEKLQKFINFCLKYLGTIELPCKRGTFIEYRTGLINVSPIGRNCSQKERDNFEIYDHKHKIRANFIEELKKQFGDYGLSFSIGGQISFDVFPQGWDKTYCLKYLKDYEQVYFFGDKTYKGGNDHELYEHLKPLGRSHSVKNPDETIKILTQVFLS